MRAVSRRGELAIQRDPRLSDAVTFMPDAPLKFAWAWCSVIAERFVIGA
jgi:hypothetical protein